MRGFLLSLAMATLVAWGAPVRSAHASTPAIHAAAPAYALQIPDKKIEITVGSKDAHWYSNPVWIAIGALALIVIVLLIVVATRGGGPRIIRD